MPVFAKGFGEHDGLSGALEAFDAEGGHRLLFFSSIEFTNVGDHASEAGMVAVCEFIEAVQVSESAVLKGPLVAGKRVPGNIESDEFTFGGEKIGFAPRRAVRQFIIGVFVKGVVFHEVKNGSLTGSFVFGDFGGSAKGDIDAFKKAGSMHAGEIEGAGTHETFNHFTIGTFHADAKIHETVEEAIGFAFFDNLFYKPFADAFDGNETKTNNAFANGIKAADGFIDGGGKHLNIDFSGFGNKVCKLVAITHFAGEECGHKFTGVVRFEPGGLIGDEAVGGGVGFIEPVLGKFFDIIEDGSGEFGIDLMGFFAAGDKFFALGGHDFWFFLAHSTAKNISLSKGEAGELLGGLLNLFLIDDNAIGFL